MIYSIDGKVLNNHGINYEYKRDTTTGAFYSVVNIPQTDSDGNKQYPFVYWPDYPNGGSKSTYDMNLQRNFIFAMNAGRFASPVGTSPSGKPQGIVIQNGASMSGTETASQYDRVLTIDSNGTLGYTTNDASPQTLINNGIVSAVSGFCPIIDNFGKIENTDDTVTYPTSEGGLADSQRQVLGQYANGDYIVITTEGRNNQGGGFFTVPSLQDLCISYGVRFAFLLDGGGSTQTVVKKRQLNPFYSGELQHGRPVPTHIVFNGTTEFSITG